MRRLASAVSPASTARRSSSSTGAMSGAAGRGLIGTKKRSCDSETTCRSAGPNMTAPTLPLPTTRPCSHVGAPVAVSNTVVLTSRSPCVLLAEVHASRRGGGDHGPGALAHDPSYPVDPDGEPATDAEPGAHRPVAAQDAAIGADRVDRVSDEAVSYTHLRAH